MAPGSSPKGLLRFLDDCDSFPYIDISKTPYTEDTESAYYQFLLPGDPRPHGFISPLVVHKIPWTNDFEISRPGELPRTVQLLDSSGGADTSAACNAALAKAIRAAIATNEFDMLQRLHNEDFKILGANPPVQMLRSAAPLFGIACRGAHMTVFVQSPEGVKIWVPRRSMSVKTYPGMLDSSVAGGIRAEESPLECILHEADEEASLDVDLVRSKVRSCGVITSVSRTGQGRGANLGLMVPECIYLYDLEVGTDVVLKPLDGEVKEFYLWDIETVKAAMENGEFKPNCAVVLIHFFIRHGIITPENEKDYLELITRMHRTLPVPTSAPA